MTPLEIISDGLPEMIARALSDFTEISDMAQCTTNMAATGKSPCISGVETLSMGVEIISASRMVMANS